MSKAPSTCALPPSLEELAREYAAPHIAQLFNQKAEDVVIAEVYDLSIIQLDIYDANCSVKFSYIAPGSSDYTDIPMEGFKVSLETMEEGKVLLESVHLRDDDLDGRFNLSSGRIAFEGLDKMQFIIDHPPESILKELMVAGAKTGSYAQQKPYNNIH